MATSGMAGLAARIAAIQGRFGAAGAPAGQVLSTSSVTAPSFESVLGQRLATPTATTTAGTGRVPTAAFADLFARAGAAHGVDPDLLAAVAQVESGLDPSAVSPAGAQGLMQLMPGTAAELGVDDPFDPAQSVDGAARLLRSHLDRFGSVELALAAYNAGAGAVGRHGGIPPYPETQAYVRRVLDRLGGSA